MRKRNLKQLLNIVVQAKSTEEKAIAYYNLALFHDNNSREQEAIPYYLKAIELGLPDEILAQAYAWLSSSLYKTNKKNEALEFLARSQRITKDEMLESFLSSLKKRIVSLQSS